MQEVNLVKGIDGDVYPVEVAKWWLCKRNATDGNRFLLACVNRDNEEKIIFKKIKDVTVTADNEDAIIAIGSKANWLLWREDDAEKTSVVLHSWKFEGIDKASKKTDLAWTAGLYLVISAVGRWTRDNQDIPHVKLSGMRNTNGFITEVTDDILCILKTSKGWIAVSERHLYELNEEPENIKKLLKPFKGLY